MANDKVIVGGGYVDKNGEYRRLPDRTIEGDLRRDIEAWLNERSQPEVLMVSKFAKELFRGKSSR